MTKGAFKLLNLVSDWHCQSANIGVLAVSRHCVRYGPSDDAYTNYGLFRTTRVCPTNKCEYCHWQTRRLIINRTVTIWTVLPNGQAFRSKHQLQVFQHRTSSLIGSFSVNETRFAASSTTAWPWHWQFSGIKQFCKRFVKTTLVVKIAPHGLATCTVYCTGDIILCCFHVLTQYQILWLLQLI